jgi:hypothetical protein
VVNKITKAGRIFIFVNRIALTVGVTLGLPLSLCLAQNDQNPVEKTGKTIEHGAAATGRTVKHGAEATARTVGKGVRKTGQTLEHAGQGTSSSHAAQRHHVRKPSTTSTAKTTPSPAASPAAMPATSPSPMAAPQEPAATPAVPAMTPKVPAATPTPGS